MREKKNFKIPVRLFGRSPSGPGMENWLYDEDRWPSGSAGGMVTRYKKYRAKFLEMTLLDRTEYRRMRWTQNLVAVFAYRMEEELLYSKRRLCKGDRLEAGETAVVFRKIYAEKNDNYNGYCYVDTMSREATDYFLKITHEKYRKKCGKRLGTKLSGAVSGKLCNAHSGMVPQEPYASDGACTP